VSGSLTSLRYFAQLALGFAPKSIAFILFATGFPNAPRPEEERAPGLALAVEGAASAGTLDVAGVPQRRTKV
jgi:hypothetical protein